MTEQSTERLFSFRTGSTSGPNGGWGASVVCLRCGRLVAIGKFASTVYPAADTHVCDEETCS